MNAQPALPFFTSPRCEVLKPPSEGPSDIQDRVHRNTGSHKKKPVAARARAWMDKHPEVYALFVRYAFDEADCRKRGSAKFIAECLRRRKDLASGKPYKIPNAYVTYMALRFMDEHPAHAGLFISTKRK